MQKTIAEIAAHIDGTIVGDSTLTIQGITTILMPFEGHIAFIDHQRYLKDLEASDIACLIVPETVTESSKPIIRVKNPKLAFAHVFQLFYPARTYSGKIAKNVSIAETTTIGANVTIEDFVVIGENTTIEDNATLRANCYIDKNVTIGAHSVIHPNVTIYDNTVIGKNVIIHSGTVVGSDGFGYIKDEEGTQVKIPQVGNVIIEDNVEIGSNVSIDRATFGATIIKKGVKIDNLVQVAHNVTINDNTVISGHAGIAGSTTVGKNCTIAAQVGIADHCVIEDNVMIAGQSGVPSKKRIPANNIFIGSPARPFNAFRKQQGAFAKLPHLAQDIKEMKKQLEETSEK